MKSCTTIAGPEQPRPCPRRTSRGRTLRRAVALLGAVIAGITVVSGGGSPSASAHFVESAPNPNFWYFSPWTWRNDSPPTQKSDPVTIIFQGQYPQAPGEDLTIYNSSSVKAWINLYWKDQKMQSYFCNGRQRMVWRTQSGAKTSDKEDLNLSTSSQCKNQVHMRLWDDYEHDQQFGDWHHRNKWVVGGVHKEIRCFTCVEFNPWTEKTHELISTFERQARNTGRLLEGNSGGYLCTNLKWKFLYGSVGAKGKPHAANYSDGYLTRIMYDGYPGC